MARTIPLIEACLILIVQASVAVRQYVSSQWLSTYFLYSTVNGLLAMNPDKSISTNS
jgi:hypothetical protein